MNLTSLAFEGFGDFLDDFLDATTGGGALAIDVSLCSSSSSSSEALLRQILIDWIKN
jgi:hypothetical protein